MQNKFLLIFCLLVMVFALSGCTSQASDEPIQKLSIEEQSISDFALLLNESEEAVQIEDFLNNHLETLDPRYIQAMVKAYESYLKDRIEKPENKLHMNHIEYDRLLQYQSYLSQEYISYLRLFKNESMTRTLNHDPICDRIGILLDYSTSVEEHLLAYPDSESESAVYELYVRYLYAALMNNGNPISTACEPEAIQMMQEFVSRYPTHHTTSFVSHYLDLLEINDFNMESDALQDFYFNFYSLLRSYLWTNEAPQN